MSLIWTHCLEAPKRVNHASSVVDDLIYSFGGYCTGEDYSVKIPIIVHCLNTNTMKWEGPLEYKWESSPEDVPFNRYGHTVVADGPVIYLWGGRNDQNSCNILYAFNAYTRTWSRPSVKGVIPSSRDGHSATICNAKMYIFGGFEDDIDRFSQEVHCLDLQSLVWSHVMTRGSPPSWRDFHTLSCIGNKLYVFGGRSDREGPYHTSSEVYDDTVYSLDLSKHVWERVSGPRTSSSPVGRRSHSAFVFNNQLFIFGGFNAVLKLHYNDLHRFDPERREWTLVSTQGKAPCPRRRQSCCLLGSRLFLFGGTR